MTIQQTSYCTFKLKFKNGEVAVNPTSKPKEEIVVYSEKDNPSLKYLDESTDGQLIVDAAGEYESKDIFVLGEKAKGKNVFGYNISSENVNVGVISFLNDISAVPIDLFEESDIILIGAGGGEHFFSPSDANNLIQKLSPKICIVFGFSEQGDKSVSSKLASLTDMKTEIERMEIAEKSFRIAEEDLERIEDTIVYYFEV